MKYYIQLFGLLCILHTFHLKAQVFPHGQQFTHQDTLRGSITPERAWWDLQHYHIEVAIDTAAKSISGKNTMTYKVVGEPQRMQIDLQQPMKLTKVVQNGESLEVEKDGNAHFITLKKEQKQGETYEMTLYFEGKPKVAIRPPWDGGITWTKDSNGLPFIASSNQGIGSSVWWPGKDHPADEPDQGVLMSVTVPENLMDVSNGRLVKTEKNKKDKTKTYHWKVTNPINSYGININIGDYVHFGEKYKGLKGDLDMDYYVLRENLDKAKNQFKDATRMMEAFEHWFGPYPFYEDSYKLVEAPYLGMEHQSSVTYGNDYENGYRGRDLSGSGWGMKFDFIIIHESGHEWFANSITNKDVADMWIHEGFTAYSENLFLEYYYGKEAGHDYVIGTRLAIQNDRPIIGTYNVNHEGSGDMYYKGANMLHTIRYVLDDDEKWHEILRGLNKEFYHMNVTTAQIEHYISEQSGVDLSSVFDQYLRDTRIPILNYAIKDNNLLYKWGNTVPEFKMPVVVYDVAGKAMRLAPTATWQRVELENESRAITVDRNFYVGTLNVLGVKHE